MPPAVAPIFAIENLPTILNSLETEEKMKLIFYWLMTLSVTSLVPSTGALAQQGPFQDFVRQFQLKTPIQDNLLNQFIFPRFISFTERVLIEYRCRKPTIEIAVGPALDPANFKQPLHRNQINSLPPSPSQRQIYIKIVTSCPSYMKSILFGFRGFDKENPKQNSVGMRILIKILNDGKIKQDMPSLALY